MQRERAKKGKTVEKKDGHRNWVPRHTKTSGAQTESQTATVREDDQDD